MKPPETRYARSGDVRIAYQVIGNGPIDLVFVPGFLSNLEVHWEDPGYSHLLQRLGAFTRLIQFDKRGTGLSDRVDNRDLPNLETRMDDVRAVMDAAGSGRIHDGANIVHPGFEVRQVAVVDPVAEAGATLVELNQPCKGAKPLEQV